MPFHELDALNHGPAWAEATPEELRARVEPLVAGDAWVIDGTYRGKLGDLVLHRADVVVWLDLPLRIWLPRLLRRTVRRIVRREELWNGNRETWRGAFWAASRSSGTGCGCTSPAAAGTRSSSRRIPSSASARGARCASGSRPWRRRRRPCDTVSQGFDAREPHAAANGGL